MPNPTPLCTHIKTNGVRCGSPALKGTPLCFHHSAVKTALGKVAPLENVAYGSFNPIPFVFPEDRAAIQINYFLLLQALNEQRVEKRAADLMLRMLKAMDKNLGKSGSLIDRVSEETNYGEMASGEAVGTHSCAKARMNGAPAVSGEAVGEEADTHDAINRFIDEVNAAAVGYADYREITALHPAGQRVLNLYCQPPMGR